ncbi:MAG TPA: LysR family transcriptional regulator [Xanthobacteraceae bacterium]|jgi:DNA-binding transcriptional LysR family regulator|nr:LysR family transcriptional regulator [Xanthobacteraceae bacterium]
MARRITDWDDRLGRRLKLRDLHILLSVVEVGSMAKAASRLGITQPAISQAVADLEVTLGVRLLDRGPRGVAPTIYGETLLRRGVEAFDVLKQGIQDIEFLADPASGEVWVGASESYVAGGFLAAILGRLAQRHPGVTIHVVEANTAALQFQELRDRKVDLMLGRISGPIVDDDLQVEVIFEEPILAVAGRQNPLLRRRRVDLADLAGEPWILAPPNTAVRDLVAGAFRAEGLEPPRLGVTTYSMQLRLQLLTSGRYLTAFPQSLLHYNADRWAIKALPVRLGPPLPVAMITLKNRTLGGAAQLFMDNVRAATKDMRSAHKS